MSDVFDQAEEIVQCKTCPWYKSCVLPMRLTEEDLRRQLESSLPGISMGGPAQHDVSQLISGLAAAAENALLEGCPVFIGRLRSSPKLAEEIKKLMQEWGGEHE